MPQRFRSKPQLTCGSCPWQTHFVLLGSALIHLLHHQMPKQRLPCFLDTNYWCCTEMAAAMAQAEDVRVAPVCLR